VGFHANGVEHRVRATPIGHLADRGRQILMIAEVESLDPQGSDALEALGNEVDADHPAALMVRDAGGHVADRPEPQHDECAALGNLGVGDALPGCRQHV
jgi:hypothetical protein